MRTHLQNPAQDSINIHRAGNWLGLDELAALWTFASPCASNRDLVHAAREAFRPPGGREPPVRWVQVGGEFRPDDRRETPHPTSHA